jgi:prepilin peptidase CpaA
LSSTLAQKRRCAGLARHLLSTFRPPPSFVVLPLVPVLGGSAPVEQSASAATADPARCNEINQENLAVDPILPVPITVVLAATLIAAVTDVWKFKVHNVLTLPLLLSGLVYHAVVAPPEAGWAAGLLNGLLGAVCGSGILLVFYLMGGMGAGDVKLMAAVGAWLGVPFTFYVFFASSLAAGLYAVVLIVAYGRVRETWVNLQIVWHRVAAVGRHLGADDRIEAEVNRADRRGRIIPFAAMVAVGMILVILWFLLAGMTGHALPPR